MSLKKIIMAIQARHCITDERLQVDGSTQKKPTSEHYICFSQGQAKIPAKLIAIQCKSIHKVNILFAEPRPGYSPSQAYGPVLFGNNLQKNILGTLAKAKLVAQPSLWPYIVGKQPSKKHSKRLSQCQAWRLV